MAEPLFVGSRCTTPGLADVPLVDFDFTIGITPVLPVPSPTIDVPDPYLAIDPAALPPLPPVIVSLTIPANGFLTVYGPTNFYTNPVVFNANASLTVNCPTVFNTNVLFTVGLTIGEGGGITQVMGGHNTTILPWIYGILTEYGTVNDKPLYSFVQRQPLVAPDWFEDHDDPITGEWFAGGAKEMNQNAEVPLGVEVILFPGKDPEDTIDVTVEYEQHGDGVAEPTIQRVFFENAAPGGNWTLTFHDGIGGSIETDLIPWTCTDTQLEDAMILAGIPVVTVTGAGHRDDKFVVTFTGTADYPLMTVTTDDLFPSREWYFIWPVPSSLGSAGGGGTTLPGGPNLSIQYNRTLAGTPEFHGAANTSINETYGVPAYGGLANLSLLMTDANNVTMAAAVGSGLTLTGAGRSRTLTANGNGTPVSVYLQSDNGNGTFAGLALLPNNLTLPAVPTSVLVYTKAHTVPAGGLQDFGNSYFAVGQVIAGFYTGQSAGGLPIVYPQHVPSLANLTVPGLVSLSNQTMGRGYKLVEGITLAYGQNNAIPTAPDNGVKLISPSGQFLAEATGTQTVSQGGSPLNITVGFALDVSATGIDYTLEFSNLPVVYPSLVLNLLDTSGAIGSGGMGVQDFQSYHGCTTLEIIHNGDNNPLPGVTLALGWVCGGQLSLGNCTYFDGTPSAYTNQTFGTIITGIYNQANLGNLTLPGSAVTDATGVGDIVTQFNALLASLRAAGIIAP